MNLTNNFLQELLKLSLTDKTTLDTLSLYLKDNYIPDELYRKAIMGAIQYYGVHNTIPTVGTLSQFIGDNEINPIMSSLRDVHVVDKKDQILRELQEYIRKARFLELSESVADMYNQGKHDEAIDYMSIESKDINEFSLMANQYDTLFGGYEKRSMNRVDKDRSATHVPTYIPQFDHYSGGGIEKGRSLLAIGRSGVGKSYFLRQASFSAMMGGHNVVHFQAEGKEDEVYEYFDAMWTRMVVSDIKYGNLSENDIERIAKERINYMKHAGEVFVVSFPQFDKASIADCRRKLIDINKKNKIGMAVFDYLEKFEPGDKKKYNTNDDAQRHRKMAVAEKITNIATEFNIATASATQANNILKPDWNNPQFVINREHISNLKATIDAFSYCLTLNQTEDEDDDEIMRIHEEKQRNYKTPTFLKTYQVQMDRDRGWFVDIQKTKELFWDEVNKKHK
jgi:replicative DNA helicase